MEAQQNLLSAIDDIHMAFLGESEREPVLARMLHHMCVLTDSPCGAIGELLPNLECKPSLHIHVSTLPALWEEDLRHDRHAMGPSEAGPSTSWLERLLTTARPVILNAPSPGAIHDGLAPAGSSWQTLLCIPLLTGPHVRGVILVADRAGGYSPCLIDSLAPVVRTCATILSAYRERVQRSEAETALRHATQHLEAQNRDLQEAHDQALAAVQAKSIFFAMMSHEMRTPLNAVIGIADLLLETPLNEVQSTYVTRISRAANSLLTLINGVLDLSKIESDRLELERIPFDLWELIETTADLMSARTRSEALEVITHIASDVPQTVKGDPTRLRQILTNLLDNAIKFTDRGEVVLRVERAAPAAQPQLLHMSVSDTGIGIPADKLDSIFEIFSQVDSFTTRKYGGTGLGLCISRRLAESMGGRMWAESTVGRGTTIHFTAELPACPQELSTALITPPSLRGQRILVVDDSATHRSAIQEILSPTGAHVVEAPDGPTALAALHAAYAKGMAFHLVILDGQMPSMDGFAVAEALRAATDLATLPIILLTSCTQGGNATHVQRLGIHQVLSKPIRRADLLAAASAALNGSSPTSRESELIVPVAPLEAEPDRAQEPTRVRRILLAEDLEDNCEIVKAYLRGTSYQLDIVEDGAAALRQFQNGHYDLILMDIQLPVMDGYEATRAIRQLEREQGLAPTPIVALTASAFPDEIERGFQAGCTSYAIKPIKKHTLLALIDQHASAPQRGRPQEPSTRPSDCQSQHDASHAVRDNRAVTPTLAPNNPLATPTGAPLVMGRPLASPISEQDRFLVHVDPDFEAFIPKFMMHRRKEVERIHRALAQHDFESIRKIAHGMKGAGGSYGFDRITAIAAAIEQAATAGATGAIEANLAHLTTYLERVQVRFDKTRDANVG